MTDNVIIRRFNFVRDAAALCSFLTGEDQERLHQIQPAIENEDAFAFVSEVDGRAVGWVVVHVNCRSDSGWEPEGDSEKFQSGDNAYLEHLEVEGSLRAQGIGRRLLAAAEAEAGRQGKRVLWLHTAETNSRAHRFYEREGWTHFDTVYPLWRSGAPVRIFCKRSESTDLKSLKDQQVTGVSDSRATTPRRTACDCPLMPPRPPESCCLGVRNP